MLWVILGVGSDDGLVWSNEYGWTENSYDVFTDEEQKRYTLPINGVWFNKDDMEKSKNSFVCAIVLKIFLFWIC